MALKAGKRDIERLANVLNGDYETVEEAAEAAMNEAWAIYESKAKFTVVGQLKTGVSPEDFAASKIALGHYSTRTQAENAALSLVYSSATHEEFRAWVLDVWHGTPATFFTARKKAAEKLAQGLTHADELSHRIKWELDNPGASRDEYPGPPRPEPRSDCPICRQPDEEGFNDRELEDCA